jgi:hypothetical protein
MSKDTIHLFNNLSVKGLIANGQIGTPGQTLSSNGTVAYWSDTTGYTGSAGTNGYTGSIGYTGSRGELGYHGSTGFAGSIGYTGSRGELGYHGSTGFAGSVGFTGSQGPLGYHGSTGFAGSVGFTGSIGYTGSWGGTAQANVDMNGYSINNANVVNAVNVNISGNLVVSGATTTVNTTNLDVFDAIIRLNRGQSTPLNDIGILMQRYATADSTNYNVGFAWDEATDRLIFGTTPEDGSDNDLSFASEWMTIAANGNVGIGNSTPSFKVHTSLGSVNNNTTNFGYNIIADAAGNIGYSGYNLSLNNSTANASGFVRLARTASTTYLGMEIQSQSRDGIRFLTNATTPVEVVRIDATGNTGIGNTSPQALLHVYGAGPQARWDGGATDMRHEYYRNGVREGYISWDTNIMSMAAPQTAGVITFATGGTTERLRIAANGNVGIGNTVPGSRLTLDGNFNILSGTATLSNGALTVSNSGSSSATITISTANTTANGGIGTEYLKARIYGNQDMALVSGQRIFFQGAGGAWSTPFSFATATPFNQVAAAGDHIVITTVDARSNATSSGILSGLFSNYTANTATGASATLVAMGIRSNWIEQTWAGTANNAMLYAGSLNGTLVYRVNKAGDIWTAGSLTVTTTSNFGNTTVTGDLSVTGNTTLGDAATDRVTINANTITIAANASIDAGTLFIDSVNNRIGIGTATPSGTLHTIGDTIVFQGSGGSTLNVINGAGIRASSELYLDTVTSTGGDIFLRPRTLTAMFISASNGNVGIGNNAPGALLHVNGDTRLASNSTGGNWISFQRTNTNAWKMGSDGVGDIFTAVGNIVTFPQNVKIERQGLTVAPTIETLQAVDISQTWNNASATFAALKLNITDTASNANSLLMNLQTGGTSQFTVRKDGSVGVGTATPGAKLDVQQSTNTDVRFYSSDTSTKTRAFIRAGATNLSYETDDLNGSHYLFDNVNGTVASRYYIGSSGYWQFFTAGTEKLRISNTGNVGVGSTNPAVKFVVSNANAEGYEINPTGGVGGGATVSTYNRTTSAYTTLTTYSSAMTWFVGSAGTTRAIDIISSGNVGISNTAPADKLSVNGTTYLGGVTTFAGNLVLGTVGLSANGGFGSAGQVLHSNGTATYWGADDGITYDLLAVANTAVNAGILRLRDSANANDDVLVTGTGTTNVSSNATHIVINSADQYVGTVTSVSSGNGLTGSFTTSGSLAVLANTGIVANATGVFVNASYIATISSNNSTNLNGQPASFYTNASNLDTGSVPYARIPGNVINTTAAFTITGVHTYNANVILGTAGLSANGGFGSAGQVLHSNGTTTYWAADDGITSLVAANGLSGGTISSTGQLDVVGGSGLVSNVSGVHIGQGNGITVSADAINVTGGTTLTVNTSGVHVNSTLSLTDLTVTGNLTVSGTTTYINTTSLSVGDNIITLNADLPGATAPTENAGIEVNRGSSANVQFLWDETNDRWSTNGQPIAISSLVAAGSITGVTTLAAGNTTITGFANVTSINIGAGAVTANATSLRVTSNTNIVQDGGNGTGSIAGVFGYNPEGTLGIHPFLTNDLANLRLRGGTVGANTNVPLSNSNFDAFFDSTPTYAQGFANGTANTVLEFTNIPTLLYGSKVGISFGSVSWAPTSVLIEAFSEGAWVTCYSNTAFSHEQVIASIPSNAAVGTNALRFTLGANNSTRIAHMFAYDYNSDGWSQAAMPRAGGQFYGNVSVNSTSQFAVGTTIINSTSFTGTANNATYLNGQLASFYTNASNINTGTLPYAQIPANVINTTAAFTRTGVTTFSANVILGTSGLSANGGFGLAGEVLKSNGTSAYWGSAGGIGTVTSVGSGNGLTGGPIESSGTLSVIANTGIVANATGVFVNASYIATISANNATFLNGQAASFYTNASNLDTGSVPYARIPANIVNTTASFTITGVHTHNANIVFGSGFDIVSSDNFAIYDSTGTRDRFAFTNSNFYDTRSNGIHTFRIGGTNVANLTGNTVVFSPTVGTIASTDKVLEIYPTTLASSHEVRNFVRLSDLYNANGNGQAFYIKSLTNGVHYGGWMLNSTWGAPLVFGSASGGADAANSIPTSYVQISTTTLSTTNLVLSVGDTTITGFANVSVSVNSASLTVGSSFIANTTGAYHTGTINAASHTVGSSLIANSTGVYHTGVVNAASHTVGSNFIANSTGTYHTGVVNAASHTVGTSFIANSTGITSTGFANVATTLQVGTNTSTFGTAAYITATGNVGIGTSSPTVKMEIGGDLLVTGETIGVRTRFISGKASPGNTAGPLYMQWNSSDFVQVGGTTGSANFLVSNGNVGIGTTSPSVRLHTVGGSVRIDHPSDRVIDFVRSGANSYSIEHDTAKMYFYNISTANALLVFDNGGNVGIGTSSPGYKLEVNGSFAATTKSFVIDHPTKPDMKLRYGSLEGPENGVYVRGKLKDFNVIVLPDYWIGLVDQDSITVNLTAIGKHQKLYVEEIKNNCVYIRNDNLLDKNIECFYTVYAERKDVEKIIVEY